MTRSRTKGLFLTGAMALALATTSTALADPGDLDPTFDGGRVELPQQGRNDAIAVEGSGNVLVASVNRSDSIVDQRVKVSRILSDGSIDGTYAGDGTLSLQLGGFQEFVSTILPLDDGGAVLVGSFRDFDAERSNLAMVRLSAAGVVVGSFGDAGFVRSTDDDTRVMGATLDDEGRIVVTTSGYAGDQGGSLAPGAVLRFTAGGEPDGSFADDGVAPTKLRNLSAPSFDGSLVLVLGDGRGCECRRLVSIDDAGVKGSVAVRFDRRRPAGVIADASGITLSGLDRRGGRRIVFAMRRLPDGSKDASFGAGGLSIGTEVFRKDEWMDMEVDESGRVYVAIGNFSGPFYLVQRFTDEGSVDDSFGGVFGGTDEGLGVGADTALDAEQRLYIGVMTREHSHPAVYRLQV